MEGGGGVIVQNYCHCISWEKATTIKMRLSKMLFFLCFRPTIKFFRMGPLLTLFPNPLPTPFLTRPLKNYFYRHFGVSKKKSKGFSLRGTPKILGKGRKNAQKKQRNRKTKKARKSKKARIGGSGYLRESIWETDFYTPPVLGGAALLPFSAPAVYKNPVP